MTRLQTFAAEFIVSTRDYIFIRPEDRLLIMRPNKTHHLNATACEMLQMLYAQDEVDVAAVVAHFAARFGTEPECIEQDLEELLRTLAALLKNASTGSMCGATAVRVTPFGSHEIKYPVLSEIALTYRCQHKCSFCYADAPKRGSRDNEMTTAEVKRVLDRIWTEAKAPTVSFTGGEPTLREDLPVFIAYAKSLGMRTNLITNGYKCADEALVGQLAEAGLDSAQVSLEGPTAAVHDAITKTPGSFDRSIQGIRNLKACGIHTHTNTTICAENADALVRLVDFIAAELGNEYFSMNMVIRTGTAVGGSASPPGTGASPPAPLPPGEGRTPSPAAVPPLSCKERGSGGEAPVPGGEVLYHNLSAVIIPIIERAKQRGLRMVWYSPVPYCLFNPIVHGLGGNSGAAADGLLSIAPDGQVLPCSSFETGIGNLLREPFAKIWNRRTARYWRNKEFLPPACQSCDMKHICCGACPLYWDEQRGFDELPGEFRAGGLAQMQWRLKRRFIGRVKGVNVT